ncbi:ComF family protein [Paenibacillus taiwanensis]|uniref:ComF family protein n=1 Tax=Paenibacillus taiwanensis TaxID=401638 RepID=UPI0003FAA26B|nr:ComF family protein [Paenibacillus taiwanensis]
MMSGWYERMSIPRRGVCLVCGQQASGGSQSPYRDGTSTLKWREQLCRNCYLTIPLIQEMGCVSCGRSIRCSDCLRRPLAPYGLACNRSVVHYNEQMKDWLTQFKFKGHMGYAHVMAGMMLDQYQPLMRAAGVQLHAQQRQQRTWWSIVGAWLNQHHGSSWPDWITFVPTSQRRLQERGFNQAEVLASSLATTWRRPLISCLVRITDYGHQSKQSRAGRERSLDHTYRWDERAAEQLKLCHVNERNQPIHILLVDDVYTTGNTLRACAYAIQRGMKLSETKAIITSYTWARA